MSGPRRLASSLWSLYFPLMPTATWIGSKRSRPSWKIPVKPLIDLPRMVQISQDMLRQSLDALMSGGAEDALTIT